MNEDELRHAMRRSVDHVNLSRERFYRAQIDAAHRRRRRDTLGIAISSSALSALVVFCVLTFSRADSQKPAGETVDLATRVESTAQSPPSSDHGRPAVLVGASAAGRLVRIDPLRGNTTSVLTVVHDPENPSAGGLLGGVAVTADGKDVYFDVRTGNCQSEIRRISIDGTESIIKIIENGTVPTLNKDDSLLAYVRSNACSSNAEIVVRRMSDHSDQVVAQLETSVISLSWSPDSKSLMIGSSRGGLLILTGVDTDSPRLSQQIAPPASATPGTVWEWGTYLPDGRVFLSERCCGETSTYPLKSSRMLVVDLTSPNSPQVIAYGLLDRSHTDTVVDPTGHHLLYLSNQDLMVSDDGARPSTLARGLVGAAWR